MCLGGLLAGMGEQYTESECGHEQPALIAFITIKHFIIDVEGSISACK